MPTTPDTPLPRVVIQVDTTGAFQVFADDGVLVFSVSELAPSDRIYCMAPQPIPGDMLEGPMGHKDDMSAAHARVTRAVREAYGLPIFSVHATEDT